MHQHVESVYGRNTLYMIENLIESFESLLRHISDIHLIFRITINNVQTSMNQEEPGKN